MPGAGWHPWSAREKMRNKRALTHRFSRDIPAFPARRFTTYSALSSVNQLVCHRRRRDCMGIAANLAPAWARQDHAASPSASMSFAFRHIRVHRIPPRVS